MLKIFIVAVAVLFVVVGVFVIWRWTSVARGANERDEKLLSLIDPIGIKLDAGEPVSPQELAALAARPELRFLLFAALREMKRPDLLPSDFSSSVAEGESALVYWMMHPNELQAAPERIELVDTLRRHVDGRDAQFHVFRFRMPPGHWAAKDGWELGLAGPMPEGAEPYAEMPSAFSRGGDIEGTVKPAELVDWYIDMLRQKGIIE